MFHEEQSRKRNIRSLTGMRVRRGIIMRESCEVCGLSQAQAHHRDYDDPILLNWLCVQCHADSHNGRLDGEINAVLALTAEERRARITVRLPTAANPPIPVPDEFIQSIK